MRKDEFIKKCENARELQIKMDNIMNEIYDQLQSETLELPSEAENADNIGDAISCYIHYGEYDLESIWHEITHS